MTFRIVHYINQFYAGIGGEDKAHIGPESRPGVVGPGMALDGALGEGAEVVGTVICGDSYYGEHMDEARLEVLAMIKAFDPDGVVAGPGFFAGRYGVACGDVCASVEVELKIPAVTALYHENPGAEIYASKTYIVKASDSARGMKDAVDRMASLLMKRLRGETLRSAEEEGYLSRGVRKVFFHEKTGAQRAVEMLMKKMKGEPFQTEYEMPVFDKVPPSDPIENLSKATIAIITSGGIVPKGNPDRIRVSSAESYGRYDISALNDLTPDNYESIHGGYDTTWANQNPDVVLPLDVMRELEKEGVIGKLYRYAYCTTGTGTAVGHAERFGQEIGVELKENGVDGVILTST